MNKNIKKDKKQLCCERNRRQWVTQWDISWSRRLYQLLSTGAKAKSIIIILSQFCKTLNYRGGYCTIFLQKVFTNHNKVLGKKWSVMSEGIDKCLTFLDPDNQTLSISVPHFLRSQSLLIIIIIIMWSQYLVHWTTPTRFLMVQGNVTEAPRFTL